MHGPLPVPPCYEWRQDWVSGLRGGQHFSAAQVWHRETEARVGIRGGGGGRPVALGIFCLEEWGQGGSAPTVAPSPEQRWLCGIRP